MEKMGIISLIQEPTNWCAGMVPVQKKNGQVHICVNLTRLNESVKRELHPLPVVEHILVQWHVLIYDIREIKFTAGGHRRYLEKIEYRVLV